MTVSRCPKCDAPRVEGGSCPHCGIVYARYRAPGSQPPKRGGGGGLLIGVLLLAATAAAGAWWWLKQPAVPPDTPSLAQRQPVEGAEVVEEPTEEEPEGDMMARLDPHGLLSQPVVVPEAAVEARPGSEALAPAPASSEPSAGQGITCRQSHSPSTTIRKVQPREIPRRVRGSLGCVVLLEYYAAWCPTCQANMPKVGALAERWRPHGLAVHAFASPKAGEQLAEQIRAVRPAYDPLQLEPFESGQVSAALAQLGASYPGKVPYFALFDSAGNLVWEGTSASGGVAQVESLLPELLR